MRAVTQVCGVDVLCLTVGPFCCVDTPAGRVSPELGSRVKAQNSGGGRRKSDASGGAFSVGH